MKSVLNNKTYIQLKDIELWKNQRPPNENLIDEMYDKQIEFHKKYGYYIIPGSIGIVVVEQYKYIIDGQHRLLMMKKLYELRKKDVSATICEYTCKTMNEADELYSMLNHINSVNVMVQDGQLASDGIKLRTILEQLKKMYGHKVWDAKKIVKPYVNIGLLNEELCKSTFLKCKSIDEILLAIKERNDVVLKDLKLNDSKAYKEVIEQGGFCLHYKEPKAKWVRTLF